MDLKDSRWFVSHGGKFSKDVNGRVNHQKESSKDEGADEKMSKWCRVHRAKGVPFPSDTKEEHRKRK